MCYFYSHILVIMNYKRKIYSLKIKERDVWFAYFNYNFNININICWASEILNFLHYICL